VLKFQTRKEGAVWFLCEGLTRIDKPLLPRFRCLVYLAVRGLWPTGFLKWGFEIDTVTQRSNEDPRKQIGVK